MQGLVRPQRVPGRTLGDPGAGGEGGEGEEGIHADLAEIENCKFCASLKMSSYGNMILRSRPE